MKRVKYAVLFAVIMAFSVQTVWASKFEDDLRKLAGQNAKNYVSPLATGLGMSMNSGIYRTAKVHKLLGFDVAINFSGFAVPKDKTTYNFELPDLNFAYQGTEVSLSGNELYGGTNGQGPEVPNLFGERGTTTLTADQGYARTTIANALGADPNSQAVNNLVNQYAVPLTVPGGIGIRFAGAPSAQAAVGLPMGTELQVRYTPKMDLGHGIGTFSVTGGGLRISIDQFIPIPLFPVDIAAGVFFQKTELGPVSLNNSILHAEVSRGLPFITVYGGLGLEKSTMKVDYTIDLPSNPALDGQEVNFKIDGDNQFRATVGARFKILIFNLNADYSIGAFSAANVGIGLSFR